MNEPLQVLVEEGLNVLRPFGAKLREAGWPAELWVDRDDDSGIVTVSLRIELTPPLKQPVEASSDLPQLRVVAARTEESAPPLARDDRAKLHGLVL